MKLRHEQKHPINYCDLLVIRERLRAVAQPDEHCKNGKYEIRSLYFDDLYDTALREKLNGVGEREKFRIRLYNGDASFIVLEKKIKTADLCGKQSARLSPEEAEEASHGGFELLKKRSEPLITEFRSKLQSRTLVPKTIVDYTREPFVFAPGNVRVTFDYNIRTGLCCTELLSPGCVTVPVPEQPIIMEIKWDEFLPDIIRDAVFVDGRTRCAFSKYAACRAFDC